MQKIKLIECPRDAMQGIKRFIPTEDKISYLQSLLKVGFHTLDCGSFVSPKAVPQMRDTPEVIRSLDLSDTKTKLLVIVANLRGAEEAVKATSISYLGYPFSISENFQMRNTHKTITESVTVLQDILKITHKAKKQLVVYLSMGFGNPYGDPWSVPIVKKWVERLHAMGVKIISLSDTVGTAISKDVYELFSSLIPQFPDMEFGAHFHALPSQWYEKLQAAFDGGCLRFDASVKGFGGCPMAQDALVGNLPMEHVISYFAGRNLAPDLDLLSFEKAFNHSWDIFY